MPSHLIIALLLMFTVYQPDETLRRYGAAGHEWHLVTLHGAAFDAHATLTFPRRNVVTGKGPCNRFQTTNSTPYPWITFGPIAATRRVCPELDAETAFFAALETASIVVIEGDTMTLSDEEKPLMVFKARD